MTFVISGIKDLLDNMRSYFNLSVSYFQKRNPFMVAISNMIKTIYIFLTSGKRIKALKYQVRLMHYRMHQMEKLMNENNRYNSLGGSSLNKYR